jgi:hypothetical protein
MQVIECYLGDLRLKLKDRIICPAWRANCMVERKPNRKHWKKSKKLDTKDITEMSGCYAKCELEYFATNKVMMSCTLLTERFQN